MSSFLSQLPSWDLKRTLAHVFPGFLLYIGFLMTLDTFVFQEQSTITLLLFRPEVTEVETLAAVIGIGVFLGSIFGIMIDGIGHWLFEDRWFGGIVEARKLSKSSNITIKEAEDNFYTSWIDTFKFNDKGPHDFPDFFYPFTYKSEDTIKLKDNLISDYYSYFEFYLNSAISLTLVSFVLPFYTLTILGMIWQLSIVLFVIVLSGSFLLFYASIHTLEDYKRARLLSIQGYMDKTRYETSTPEEQSKINTKTIHSTSKETKGESGKPKEIKETYTETIETQRSQDENQSKNKDHV